MSVPNVSCQPGMRDRLGVVRGQLEEAADRRAALVQLAGRVEEARAKANGHGARVRRAAASAMLAQRGRSRASVGAM